MEEIEKKKLEALIMELEKIKGRHTELVTVYVPAGFSLIKVVAQIRQEQSTAINIKSKAVRKNVTGALERILQHLKLFKDTPPNGLVVFCGNISEKEGDADLGLWSVEPPEPVRNKLYWCGQNFILDPLRSMIREREIFGIILIDKSDADVGVLKGKRVEALKHMDSIVPGKTKVGGWCVHEGSRIQLSDGRIVKVKDLGEEPFFSLDFSSLSLSNSRHNHFFERTSDRACLIRTTAPAIEIRATPEHKFFVLGKDGYIERRAGNLSPGDRLLAVKRIRVSGKPQMIHSVPPLRYTITEKGMRYLTSRRKALGLKQSDVAKKLGVSQAFISKFELGEREMQTGMLKKLLGIYSLRPSSLERISDRRTLCSFPETLTQDFARFIGYFLGDGNIEKDRIGLNEADEQLVKKYGDIAEKIFSVTPAIKKRDRKNYYECRMNSKALADLLRKEFPGVFRSGQREIPDSVCKSHDSVVAAFLAGLWDAEGYVTRSNNSIGITMRDSGVIEKLQLMLLRFGIISSLKRVGVGGSFSKVEKSSLVITDGESILRFIENVGFLSGKKAALVKAMSRLKKPTFTDQIPVSGSYVLKLVHGLGMTTNDFPKVQDFFFDKKGMSYGIFRNNILPIVERRVRDLKSRKFKSPEAFRRFLRVDIKDIGKSMGISKSTVLWHRQKNPERVIAVLEGFRKDRIKNGNAVLGFLKSVSDSDLISARIRSVNSTEPDGKFYDMEIPKFRNFIANGIVVHNSQARYARVRENLLNDFMKKVGEISSKTFLEMEDLKGVIVSGPGPVKEDFSKGDYLDYRIKEKIIGLINTSYTGETGLNETVERAEDILAEASVTKEKKILERFFGEFAKDSGLAIYGLREVVDALKSGNMELLLVSEAFNKAEVLFRSDCGYESREVVRRPEISGRKCPRCGGELKAAEEKDVLSEIIKLAESMDTKVELISTDTRMGEQLKELGEIAGILRYRIE